MTFLYSLLILALVTAVIVVFWIKAGNQKNQQQVQDVLQQVKQQDLTPIAVTDLVDRLFVIAIPSRMDYIIGSLKTYGLLPGSYAFVPPVMKTTVNTKELPLIMKPGEVACYRSHLRAMRMFLQDPDANTALILEDDIRLCPSYDLFQKRLAALKQELQTVGKWDIVYFGRCLDRCFMNKSVSLQLVKNTSPICLHAYALTRKGARKILRQAHPIQVPIDILVLKLVTLGKLKALSVSPSLFYQNKDIDTTLDHPKSQPECAWDKHNYYKDQM